MVWLVLRGVCPVWRVAVLLPMALSLGVRWCPCPPSCSETSVTHTAHHPQNTTKGGVRWAMGDGLHVDASPAHAITRRGTRCQSEERAPQLTHTSGWTYWYVTGLPHTISHNVNPPPLQYTPNLLNILHIYASNANAALNLAITVLNDFKLKRDTVQTENDLPAQ